MHSLMAILFLQLGNGFGRLLTILFVPPFGQ